MPDDFWSVWQAGERLFPAHLSGAFLHGMTGSALHSGFSPLLHSDLTCWLLPGLAACGVQAELYPFSEDASASLQWLHERLRRHAPIPLFAFAVPAPDVEVEKLRPVTGKSKLAQDFTDNIKAPDGDTEVTAQALVVAIEMSEQLLTLQSQNGTLQSLPFSDALASYTHSLALQRGSFRRARGLNQQQAIRSWALFACAFPDRILGVDMEDANRRALAGEFWRLLADKERSALATRLRSIAEQIEHAAHPNDIASALEVLYQLACASYDLPPEVENALRAPTNAVLTEIERRELIYLCRAGTRDLKILAAHRLHFEREYPDARATLQQLQYDAEAWVRRSSQ